MKNISKQLIELKAMLAYITESPFITKRLISNEELKHISSIKVKDSYPLLQIRWLKLMLVINGSSTAIENKWQYIDIAEKVRGVIKNFADKIEGVDRKTEYNENTFKSILEEQLNDFLSTCILDASETALYYYRNAESSEQAESKVPTIAKIWEEALSRYNDSLYRESIHEFETTVLVNRHTKLSSHKASLQREHASKMTLDKINLELGFFEDKLGLKPNSSRDFVTLKLQGTSAFLAELTELNRLSLENLHANLELIRSKIGQELIDPMLSRSYTIINKTIEDNFYNGNFGCISNHLRKTISKVDEVISNIAQPGTVFPILIESKDKKILRLRELTSRYIEHLELIEKNEKELYSNRNEGALITRKQALRTLSQCLNQSSELTTSVMDIAKALIYEIKLHQPHWSELSFLNKIIDLLTLGIRSLIRYSTFKENKPEAALVNYITEESTPVVSSVHETTFT